MRSRARIAKLSTFESPLEQIFIASRTCPEMRKRISHREREGCKEPELSQCWTCTERHIRTLEDDVFEALFGPMHLLVLFFFLVVCGVGFVILRLLWTAGSRSGK